MLCKIKILGCKENKKDELHEAIVVSRNGYDMAVLANETEKGTSFVYNDSGKDPQFTVIETYGTKSKLGKVVSVEKTTITELGEKKTTESILTTYGD